MEKKKCKEIRSIYCSSFPDTGLGFRRKARRIAAEGRKKSRSRQSRFYDHAFIVGTLLSQYVVLYVNCVRSHRCFVCVGETGRYSLAYDIEVRNITISCVAERTRVLPSQFPIPPIERMVRKVGGMPWPMVRFEQRCQGNKLMIRPATENWLES